MKNIITPLEIVDRPTDPYRITGILEELRRIWDREPKLTFGETLVRILRNEYGDPNMEQITDDELVAAIQNYGN